MEDKVLFWNDERQGYYRWNEETKSFSTRVKSDGWNLAEDPFAEVVSVIFSFSGESPEATFVYPHQQQFPSLWGCWRAGKPYHGGGP